jgi:hypothetical protein
VDSTVPLGQVRIHPTLIAFKLNIVDLAGNVVMARTTALYSPSGYAPAAVVVTGVCRIDSAISVQYTNILTSGASSYTAPHVWQSQTTAMKVRNRTPIAGGLWSWLNTFCFLFFYFLFLHCLD